MKIMTIELTSDYGEEIMRMLREIDVDIRIMKEKLAEKDKKILELETKLEEHKNGSCAT